MQHDSVFGYSWNEIKAWQQGQKPTRIIQSDQSSVDRLLEQARTGLSEHGPQGLLDQGFMGWVDVLKRAGEWPSMDQHS